MAAAKEIPLAERISATYPKLRSVAKDIHEASDELAKAIAPIEKILKKLNIGVPTWTMISGNDDDEGSYWSRDIGYTKLNAVWGLAIRTTSGYHNDPDSYSEDSWPFNDAPRWLRVDAIAKLPDLLETIVKRAEETTKKLRAKAKQASEIAALLQAAASALEDTGNES